MRQQFTTEAEVRLAQASVRLFEELGAPLFEQVGYLFLATTEAGLRELEERRALQASFGVPWRRSILPSSTASASTTCSARRSAARTGSQTRGVTRELVRRAAALGVEVRVRRMRSRSRPRRSCSPAAPSRARWQPRAGSSCPFARWPPAGRRGRGTAAPTCR